MAQMLSELLVDVPEGSPIHADEVAAARAAAGENTIYVVLDDDPTGTQSVADLPVLTHWEVEDFEWAFATGKPAVYVMTNSRSLAPEDAAATNRAVVASALQAAAGRRLAFVSRSDSTLRGHFPLEPDVIAEAQAEAGEPPVDGVVIVPAFGDAGRITVHGVHYAGSTANGFIPVGESEFAKDATFGYKASRLAEWVEEKTHGRIPAADVIAIDLTTLRQDPEGTVAQLRQASNRVPIVVDIVDEQDLRRLALALIEAEAAGSRFIYRVGPPFVRARIGQEVHAPLTIAEVTASRGQAEATRGGLIVVGSHVALTTRQLEQLKQRNSVPTVEIDVASVIDPARRADHLDSRVELVNEALQQGNVVVCTSRTLVVGTDGDDSLRISREVSAAVVELVQRVVAQQPPRFVVAKGGITSSDVATKGLGIRRASVIGPMLPGIVSLWSGQDGPAAGVPYVVFAGNVGGDESLADVVDKLSQA